MLNPPINELIALAGNRYSLVVAASKRARLIINGEEPLSYYKNNNPLSIAIQEIYEGNVTCHASEEE